MILASHGIVSSSGGVTFDSDAQAFFTAASITDNTQKTAVNTLVTDLKTANIWTKIKALYPFVGGTAASHKWNLKDPRDLDAAYRLIFSGGWTHSSTGALPNGTNAYANTFLSPISNLVSTSGFGYYSRTNSTIGNQADMGLLTYMPVKSFALTRVSTLSYFSANGDADSSFTDTDTRGFYQVYRTNSTTVKALKNTTSYSATLPVAIPSGVVIIGARNENTLPSLFSFKEFAFTYIQENFNDTDAANLNTAVQSFQTTLSRNV
jgi:hypothetical protein